MTQAYPHDVVTGDFDEDGILDLAVAVAGSSTVAVFRGQGTGGIGNGTFSTPSYYAAGPYPYGLITGDFNEDGVTDIVTADYGSNTVSVLPGLGTGGVGNGAFGPAASYAAGSAPFKLGSEDLNEDGIADLVVANNASGDVSVLLGQGSGGTGDGSFGAPTNYPTGVYPSGVVIADFNSDGILDLATSSYGSDRVSVLLGQGSGGVGDGTLAAAVNYSVGVNPFHLNSGDFNEDGITDLVTGNSGSHNVSILLGNGSGGAGDGTFGAAIHYPTGVSPNVVASDDFDRDGIADLMVSNAISNDVSLLLGQGAGGVGNGSFSTPAGYGVGSYPISVTTGDFDENGRPDVVAVNYLGGGISILLGRCTRRRPLLVDVRDVPNDEGGKVFLTWMRSELDVPGGVPPITGYRVWRRIPPALADAQGEEAAARSGQAPIRAVSLTRADGTTEVTFWEAIATLPAEFLEGYGYTAPTTQDSMAGSNPYTAFFVTALTSNPAVFFQSNIDSGYSVDNLPPGPPAPFVGEYLPDQVALHWGVCAEPDFLEYRLYRGTSGSFTPSPGNLISAQRDTGFVDPAGTLGHFYKLSSLDIHGNESRHSLVSPAGATQTLVSFGGAEVVGMRVRLTWQVAAGTAVDVEVERRNDGGAWAVIGTVVSGAGGVVLFEDQPEDGRRYAYRLAFTLDGNRIVSEEAWVLVPRARLAIHAVSPNPSAGALKVTITLPTSAAARVELIDVTGRIVRAIHLTVGTAGTRQVEIGRDASLAPGLYVIRLVQDLDSRSTKAAVIR